MADRKSQRRLERFLRALPIAGLLSLAAGYVLFLGVFPTVAFPASGEASIPLAVLILGVTAVVAGLASEDLVAGMAAVVSSVAGGIVVAGLMGLSPLAGGLFLMDPGSMFGFLVHYGFVFLVLTFTLNLVGVIIGYGMHERFIVQRPQTFAEAAALHRK